MLSDNIKELPRSQKRLRRNHLSRSLLTTFSRSVFSRYEQPQLPPPCWPATSQSSAFSEQCPHPGSALCPGAVCRPLPLPPGGWRFTTARLRCPRQTQLQSACCDVAGPLHGGGRALQPGNSIRDQLVAASIAFHARTEQVVRVSGGRSTFTLGTTSDRQHQCTRTTGKNLNVHLYTAKSSISGTSPHRDQLWKTH